MNAMMTALYATIGKLVEQCSLFSGPSVRGMAEVLRFTCNCHPCAALCRELRS